MVHGSINFDFNTIHTNISNVMGAKNKSNNILLACQKEVLDAEESKKICVQTKKRVMDEFMVSVKYDDRCNKKSQDTVL